MEIKKQIISITILLLIINLALFVILDFNTSILIKNLIADALILYLFYLILRNQKPKEGKTTIAHIGVLIFNIIGTICMVVGFPMFAYFTLQQNKSLAIIGAIIAASAFICVLISMLFALYIKNSNALKKYLLTILVTGAIAVIDFYITTFTKAIIFRFIFVILALILPLYIFFYPIVSLTKSLLKKSK